MRFDPSAITEERDVGFLRRRHIKEELFQVITRLLIVAIDDGSTRKALFSFSFRMQSSLFQLTFNVQLQFFDSKNIVAMRG